MSKDTGGPAFPHRAVIGSRYNPESGMNEYIYSEQPGAITLRDYFAAKVMQGLCVPSPEDGNPDEWNFEYLAKVSYVAADAMIAERNRES